MRVRPGANSKISKLMTAFGHQIITTTQCQNSMEWGKKLLATQPHGTLLLAEKHCITRGRQGRHWVALPGQLLLTYLIKPEYITPSNTHGTIGLTALYYALSVGLCSALQRSEPATRIKWPNDCVINNKKVAGMLLEPVWHGSQLIGLVLGIGVNINTTFTDHAELKKIATSLSYTNQAVTMAAVQTHINHSLTTWYQQWQCDGPEEIWQQWSSSHLPLGSTMSLHTKTGTVISGTLTHLDCTGSITLATATGDKTLSIADI